jgi:hypothetical protein
MRAYIQIQWNALSAPTNCCTDMLAVAAKLGAVASASSDPSSVSTAGTVTPSSVTPQLQQSPPGSPGSNETSPFKVLFCSMIQ